MKKEKFSVAWPTTKEEAINIFAQLSTYYEDVRLEKSTHTFGDLYVIRYRYFKK